MDPGIINAMPQRKPRCRMTNATSDRCQNEVVDEDPRAPQICPRHALEGAQLLADAGVITIEFAAAAAGRVI